MTPIYALLALQAAAVDPVKDPNLAKPVTVHLALTPLRQIAAALQKEAGQPIDVSGAVADWKATVLVKALPAGRTMEALADTLGLVWKLDNGTYRLGRAEGSANAETAYLQSERTQRQPSANEVRVETAAPGVPRLPVRGNRRTRDGAPMRVAYARYNPTLLALETPESPAPTRLAPAVPSGDLPFAKAAAAWPSMDKEIPAPWLAPVATPKLPASPWEGGLRSLGDLLTLWHDASGLPVVADAFRVPARSAGLAPGTALESLQGLASAESASFRFADGVARLRHPGFWRLREQEIPESTWSGLERGPKTVDALASFAARLTAAQAASFRSLEAPLSKVKTAALREAYPALLLWNALPAPARKALLAGTPVGLAAVQNARGAYTYALNEAPYYHAGDPSPILELPPARTGLFGQAVQGSLELRLAGERGGGVTYVLAYP